MISISRTSIFLLLAFAFSGVHADGVKPVAVEHVRIFLLIGQSNMAGRGVIEPEDKEVHPRVLMLTKADVWVPATSPLHFDKPTVVGVGPGLAFGKVIADALKNETIGLVPCAMGGTSIDQWEKGGKLYEQAVRRAKVAAKNGTLAGILWHQGESDQAPAKAAAYTAKALELFTNLRKDLNAPDVPVIVGTIGDWRAGTEAINDVLRKLPETVPHCGLADAMGLKDKGDHVHFDAASARELGKRYAAEWIKLTLKTKKGDGAERSK